MKVDERIMKVLMFCLRGFDPSVCPCVSEDQSMQSWQRKMNKVMSEVYTHTHTHAHTDRRSF